MSVAMQDEKLTLKKLQNHIIKTILGALAVAVVGALITSWTFYKNAQFNLEELNESKMETSQDIKELKKDVNEIKISLSTTGLSTNTNQKEIDELKSDIKEIKKSQEEMMKLLYTISKK
jgi:peptidoglycan hydrolase CwlO-like protein